jgi:hypothetical protein
MRQTSQNQRNPNISATALQNILKLAGGGPSRHGMSGRFADDAPSMWKFACPMGWPLTSPPDATPHSTANAVAALFFASAPSHTTTRSAVLNIDGVRRAWWHSSFEFVRSTHACSAHTYRG